MHQPHSKTVTQSFFNGRDTVGDNGWSDAAKLMTPVMGHVARTTRSTANSILSNSPSTDQTHNVHPYTHHQVAHHRNKRPVEATVDTIENGTNQMTLEQSICDDLQMFEYRLEEVLKELRPRSKRWQVVLVISFLATMFGAFQWLTDPETYEVSFMLSVWNHKFFTVSCLILIVLFVFCGIHQRIFAPSIITGRVREVISQFNMSCNDRGKLILMPHPNFYHHKNGYR